MKMRIRNKQVRAALGEFVGTFLLVVAGCGLTMSFALTGGKLTDYNGLVIGWGVLVWLMVSALYNATGGHLNMAVSLTFCSLGIIGVDDFFVYIAAQMLGSVLGYLFAYHLYSDILNNAFGHVRAVTGAKASAGLWAGFPPDHVSNYTAFLSGFFTMVLLLFLVLAIIDPRCEVPKFLHAPAIGAAVSLVCWCCVANAGIILNPNLDLGARIFMLFVGYGSKVFTYHNYYFLVPLFSTMTGAVSGAWLYKATVGLHLPELASEQLTPSQIPTKN